MGRTYTGKSSTSLVKVKQKNGDTYVYEREVGYNQETKKSYTIKKTLIGKIPLGETEIVPTRSRRKAGQKAADEGNKQSKSASTTAAKKRTGKAAKSDAFVDALGVESVEQSPLQNIDAMSILNWAGERSGINRELYQCMSNELAQKTKTIAQFLVYSDWQELQHLSAWQLSHVTPYNKVLSYSDCIRVFDELTQSPITNTFFELLDFFDSVDPRDLVILHTKASRDNPTYSKQLYFIFDKCKKAFSYENLPAYLPDVLSFGNIIPNTQGLLVTTCCLEDASNVGPLIGFNIPFLSPISIDTPWVKAELLKVRDQINSFENHHQDELLLHGMRVRIRAPLQFAKDIVAAAKKYELYPDDYSDFYPKSLYLYFFSSEEGRAQQKKEFISKLDLLCQLLEKGFELNKEGEGLASHFIKDGYEAPISRISGYSAEVDNRAADDAIAKLGLLVLVSTREMEPFKALELYRLRWSVEKMLSKQKDSDDFVRHSHFRPITSLGHEDVYYVAISYYCFLRHKLNEIKDSIAQSSKPKSDEEKQLYEWLTRASVSEILTWFDARANQNSRTTDAARELFQANLKRDELLLRKLGLLNEAW